MVTGRQFRDDTPVISMHVDLAEQGVPQKGRFRVVKRYTSLVARGFDT